MIVPFTEKQKFTQWFFFLPLVIIALIFGFVFFRELVLHKPLGTTPMPVTTVVFMAFSLAATVFLLTSIQLNTRIDHEKIEYRFFPFHMKFRTVYWTDVAKAYTRTYKPIKEYGGWGFRQSFKNGKAYNVSGNKGIQLELNSGKKILIGTKSVHEIELIFMHLKKQYPQKFNG